MYFYNRIFRGPLPLVYLVLACSLLTTGWLGWSASAEEHAFNTGAAQVASLTTGGLSETAEQRLVESAAELTDEAEPLSEAEIQDLLSSLSDVFPYDETTTDGPQSISRAIYQAYLTNLPDSYFWKVDHQPGVTIQVRGKEGSPEASLWVNDKQVVRFRSWRATLSPLSRAKLAAHRLNQYLTDAGLMADAFHLKPHDEGFVITLGEDEVPLLLVDSETAEQAGFSTKALAQAWLGQLRDAMGLMEGRSSSSSSQLSAIGRAVQRMVGMASWYGPGFHGRRCADGSRFNMYGMTAAHKTLPFGTRVRVTHLGTGKSCVVRITDRGPYAHGRIIDLSKGAASAIGLTRSGVGQVAVEVLQ